MPPGVQLAAKQELVRNNASEVETLDPNLAETVPSNNVTRDLFEGLTATDADGTVVPGVAEKWEQKDATTWIFHLRKNAKWSNGEAVVAGDFVYGCQRLVDPKIASPYASTFGIFLLNGAEIVAGKKPAGHVGRARHRPVHGRGQDAVSGVVHSGTDVEYESRSGQQGRCR